MASGIAARDEASFWVLPACWFNPGPNSTIDRVLGFDMLPTMIAGNNELAHASSVTQAIARRTPAGRLILSFSMNPPSLRNEERSYAAHS